MGKQSSIIIVSKGFKYGSIFSFFLFLVSYGGFAQIGVYRSPGEKKEIVIASNMPYIKVNIGEAEGMFLLDFGTTASTIDPKAFLNGKTPKPISGSADQFENFNFYGSFGKVVLNVQDHSNIKGTGSLKQAGIIGTDFLSLNAFLIDYGNKVIFGGQNFSCSDSLLISDGFRAVSTAGYYSNNSKKLNNSCTPNIPTVPITIGNVAAIAQIDPGFDDSIYRHSININATFFSALQSAGIVLEEKADANSELTTCVTGIKEKVKAFKLGKGYSFQIIGVDNNPVLINTDAILFVKETPLAAKSCGGIGTWQIPAAQFGASFLIDSKAILFDPKKSLVWFYTK